MIKKSSEVRTIQSGAGDMNSESEKRGKISFPYNVTGGRDKSAKLPWLVFSKMFCSIGRICCKYRCNNLQRNAAGDVCL
jgi:hypothetical protein